MILGYVKCTAPNCYEAMEVSQCSGKLSAHLKGRCHVYVRHHFVFHRDA